MRRITVRPPKHGGKRIAMESDGITGDELRRLRNALLVLSRLDAGWMWWVEREVPRVRPLVWKRRIVERRARMLTVRGYGFLGWGAQLGIIYSDYYFTDDGSLKTYL